MKQPPEPIDYKVRAALVDRITADAIAAGTHSAAVYFVCGQCHERGGSLYYITTAGVELCPKCADLIGKGPVADAARSGNNPARNRASTGHV